MKHGKKTLALVFWVWGLILCLPGLAPAQAPEKPASPQKTGDIKGRLDYCGPGGNTGLVVYLPGRSFQAKLAASGNFVLNYVPAGTYTLMVEIPGHSSETIPGVSAADNTVTDLGVIQLCRDTDGDTFAEDVDCNDNNPRIFPGAQEQCDGFDNNCDGIVDEGCAACSDADTDGFFAQAGCLTAIDCDDSDPTIRPTAQETCDGVDNNCNGQVDEAFDLNIDVNNCGACGTACSFPNSSASCVGGSCEFGDCLPSFADCDSDSANGCEANLDSDNHNCGACSHACTSGIQCIAAVCAPVCGDGIVTPESGEECDDGNNLSGDGCTADCKNEICGDGIVTPGSGEECDDGNNLSGDGCTADCKNE